MKKLAFFVETLNPFVKVFLMIATAPIGIIAIPILSQMAQNERINNILNNPTEKNVIILMEKMQGIHNHPDSWSKYRGLWNVVNRSNKVSTPTKEKFLAKLIGYGLHINNTQINDNYKG